MASTPSSCAPRVQVSDTEDESSPSTPAKFKSGSRYIVSQSLVHSGRSAAIRPAAPARPSTIVSSYNDVEDQITVFMRAKASSSVHIVLEYEKASLTLKGQSKAHIKLGNQTAHEGDVVADAPLYEQGSRTDLEVFISSQQAKFQDSDRFIPDGDICSRNTSQHTGSWITLL